MLANITAHIIVYAILAMCLAAILNLMFGRARDPGNTILGIVMLMLVAFGVAQCAGV